MPEGMMMRVILPISEHLLTISILQALLSVHDRFVLEDSELFSKPVNWLASVKCQYLTEYLLISDSRKKPNFLSLVPLATKVGRRTDYLLLPHGRGLWLCVRSAAVTRLGQGTGSLWREGKKGKNRLSKTRWGDYLQRRDGKQLSFL